MKAIKKINNNVVLAIDTNGDEVFLVGKGLGFQKMPYSIDDRSELIEKKFVQSGNLQFESLFNTIPVEVILTTQEIITFGEKQLENNLNKGLIISLADHINGSLDRINEGLELSNAFQWELKHIYPTEVALGKIALEIIKNKIGVQLPEVEASFIALHFVNAQLNNNNDFTETGKITKVIKDILNIVKYHYKLEIDEESINYARFVTHLRYFVYRLLKEESLREGKINLLDIVKADSSEELKCITKIEKYLSENYNWFISNNEKLYLIIHLQRLTKNKD